jgi:hypothetical protein
MKGNIKALAVFVMIAAGAMLIGTAMASADQPAHETIQGDYIVTGEGVCSAAPEGVDSMIVVGSGLDVWKGIYTFHPDGTGSASIVVRTISFPAVLPAATIPFSGASLKSSWDFTYTMTREGKITFKFIKESFEGEWTSGSTVGRLGQDDAPRGGTLSPDGSFLTVTSGSPVTLNAYSPENQKQSPIPTLCLVSLAGYRR